MLARRLRRKGYTVRCASSGQQALAQLQTEAADLVILDVMMPGMSGLEVVERIRKQPRLQSLPIIMATAKADSEDVVRALDLGADDYVSKPIDVDVLLARVRAQLRGKHRQLTGHSPQTPASGHAELPARGAAWRGARRPQLSLPPRPQTARTMRRAPRRSDPARFSTDAISWSRCWETVASASCTARATCTWIAPSRSNWFIATC